MPIRGFKIQRIIEYYHRSKRKLLLQTLHKDFRYILIHFLSDMQFNELLNI